MIPFSMMWGGFAFFWEWLAVTSNAPWFFLVFGVPFVLMGIYIIAGRFVIDLKQRAGTIYGVTNERIVIVSGLVSKTVKSLPLKGLSDLSMAESANGSGSIAFGKALDDSSRFRLWGWWDWSSSRVGSRFDTIPDVKSVYEIVRAAQRR
jgi:hypothetical protein